MKTRNIENKDISRIVDLWCKALPHEAIDKKQFVRKLLLDPNFSEKGFFVAEENGEILGFVNCPFFKTSPIGYISILAVCDKTRFREIGNVLLDSAENYLAGNEKTIISTGYAPLYFTQGVDKNLCPEYVELYTSRDYTATESYKRFCDLSEYTYPEKYKERKKALAEEGIYIGELTDEYILSLIDGKRPFAKPGWTENFKKCLHDVDFARIRIAAKDGEVIGCCAFGEPDGSPERFGPFGVNSDMRGKGIGTILLNDCFFEMKRRGLQCAWSQWTPGEGSAAHTVYEHYGFKKRNAYLLFTKQLNKGEKI
jgi:N-acetylglutamate synthase-like GNAT family acetyltransferase